MPSLKKESLTFRSSPDFPNMRIFYSTYALLSPDKLTALSGGFSREGSLIKIEFSDGLIGYGDCHPWTLFGDLPLDQQLAHLRCGKTTPLLQQTFHFAHIDAIARSRRLNLFTGLSIPPSHFLLSNLQNYPLERITELPAQGYRRIKIKLGSNLALEIPLLKKVFSLLSIAHLRFRLDFNSQLDLSSFEAFLHHIRPYWDAVDFCEDPLPYRHDTWKFLQEHYPIDLAADKECLQADGQAASARVLIVKPAIQDLSAIQANGQRIVVTSYLDHPIGQLGAAYAAASFHKSLDVCGLQSHNAYLTTPFSERLICCGPHLLPPEGMGIGFDDLLKQIDWTYCYESELGFQGQCSAIESEAAFP